MKTIYLNLIDDNFTNSYVKKKLTVDNYMSQASLLRYTSRGFKFWRENTPLDFSQEIHCGNGIFNVQKYMAGVMTILKYFVN